MKTILFRADGNAELGLGHLMRCLALTRMLAGSFRLRFAITDPSPDVRTLLQQPDIDVIALPTTDNVTPFLDVIDAEDIVVLDGYSFDETMQRSVRERARKLVFIDDLLAGHQVADVIINPAGGVTPADYDAEPYTQFCLGPHYALLRPAFLTAEPTPPPADGPIFVSLGGADPHNTSLSALKAIHQVDATLPVRIVLGPFHPDRASIEAFGRQLPNLTLLQGLDEAQMAAELTGCSLAITSASTVAYEVCAMNRPLIAIVTADNQSRIAQFLSEEKLAVSVNFPTLLTRMTPVIALDQMVKLAIQLAQFSPETVAETVMNQRRFFDGRSPERFRDLFAQL